jgi:general secretion pathway protein N
MVRVGHQGRSGTMARGIRVIAVAIHATLLLLFSNYATLGTPAPADVRGLDRVRSLEIKPRQAENMNGIQLNAGEASGANAPAMSSLLDSTPVTVRPPEQTAAAPERPPSANPLWDIPLATLSGTHERPIFSSSRRPRLPPVEAVPVAAAAPPPKPVKPERPQLWLVGTVADGDQGFGIFVDQTTKAALRLKIGEETLGWKLRSVHGREVTLERQRQTVIVSLPEPGADPAGLTRLKAWNAGIVEGPADLQSVLRERYGPH